MKKIPKDVIPAIGLALYLFNKETQSDEKAVLTIRQSGGAYSPWSSKLFGLRKHPKNW